MPSAVRVVDQFRDLADVTWPFTDGQVAVYDAASGKMKGAAAGATGVTSITGTANQVIRDQATGAVTLSLPQNIHSGASPTFAGATLNGTLVMGANSITFATGNSIVGVSSSIVTLTAATEILFTTDGAAAGGVYLSDGNAINGDYNVNSDSGTLAFNWVGYQGGATRFRNWQVYNGRNQILLALNGSQGGLTTIPDHLPGANKSGLIVSGYSLTGSSVVSLANLAGTINTSGVVDVVKLAVTDTAHGAGSNFLALYGGVGGATLKFAVDTAGAITIGNTVNSVSPTAPNRTVTIVINGTTYYLAAKTTND